ncbi:MAG: PKD domain-containing protein [Thermoplasmataceae archaeon]
MKSPSEKRKIAIAMVFASLMIISGVGIMAFQALSHEPLHTPPNSQIHPTTTNSTEKPPYKSGYLNWIEEPAQANGTVMTFTGVESFNNNTSYVSELRTNISGDAVNSTYQNLSVDAVYNGTVLNIIHFANVSGNEPFAYSTLVPLPNKILPNQLIKNFTLILYRKGTESSPYINGVNVTLLQFYQPTTTSSKNNIDTNQSLLLNVTPQDEPGPLTYLWNETGAPGHFSSVTSEHPTWTASGSGIAKFTSMVEDSAGFIINGTYINVTVYSDPVIKISSSVDSSDTGSEVLFSTSVSGGTGTYLSYSYTLYDGNSTTSSELASGTSSSFGYSFSSSGSFLLDYHVIDSNNFESSDSLIQVVNSDPTVSISSSQDPTDVGHSVTLTASSSGGSMPYKYQWYEDGNPIQGTNSSVFSSPKYNTTGTYTYYVVLTDNSGYAITSNTVGEIVNPDPTVSASSNVSSADVNYPIQFSSTPSGGSGSYRYNWTLNGNNIANSQDFSYSFASPGSYTLTVTVCDSIGEMSSSTVTVSIHSNPSVSIASSQNPTDVGNSVTFSSTLSGGTGSYTYAWTINGDEASTSKQFSYSFISSGTYNVSLTVTDSDVHTGNFSFREYVNPDPSVTIKVVHNPTDPGIWVNFSAIVHGGTGPFNYSWSIGNKIFYSQYVNLTFESSGTVTILLTITDANGNQITETYDEVINSDPSVTINAEYSRVDIGINDSFAANVSGGNYPYNYTWSHGNVTLSHSQEFRMSFNNAGIYVLNLTVTDSFGIKTHSSYSVIVVKKPSALIEGVNETDVSTTTTWEGYGSNGTSPYSYSWYINGISTSSGLYLQYSFPKAGFYNVSLVIEDSQGAKADAYMNVTVENLPSLIITESTSVTDVGIPVSFNSSIIGGSPLFNYTWSIAGLGIIGFQNHLQYVFTSHGHFNVSLSIVDGSENTASRTIEITINSLPKVTINPEYSNIDPNITDSFNANISGGTPGYDYTWYISGIQEGRSNSITWSFASPGTYAIKIYVEDSQGQITTYSTDVTVESYPVASIIATQTHTDANLSDHFRASGTGGIGPYKYEWIISGHKFTNITVSYSFRNPGNYSIQLVIYDSFGKDASASIYVSVFQDPQVHVNWSGNPIVSESFRMDANVTGGIAPYTISWIFPSGQHETGGSIVHVFSTSGTETFEVQVSDQSGYSETRNFTISVSLFVSITANQTSGLGPLSVQFSSSVLGSSGYSYNWTFSQGHSSLEQNPDYTFSSGNYTVRFVVTSANGALGYANITIESLPPPISFVYSSGLNITQAFHFRALPNWDASSPYNMSWSFPNGQTLTGLNISYRFPVYHELNTVIATFTYGNGQTWTQYLTVRMIPAKPSLTFTPPSLIPVDTMLSLNATASAPDSNSFTFSWDINGSSYPGQTQLYYFGHAGNYSVSVSVTDSLGASSSVSRTIEVLPQGTNSSIAISYTVKNAGPMNYYTVKVLSSHGITAVEGFLDTTELTVTETNSSYTSSGELAYFNITMDQRDYSSGTYGIQIVAFNNNSQSNHITMPFSVSSQFSSSTFSLGDLISFFGGFSNFLITILTLGGLLIAWASLRRSDNPDVTIVEGSGKGSKRIQLKGRKIR